ncbi:MAG: SAM-dependent methyltransferase [Deltaproteobacteria bacterium CG_4_9_14_0_2_um_filter_42_21]|nr:MAG: SAM-dependent methyltransferase [Deltaproteobacteria bacterium CG_4_9_14_0_2_um_filter_42_21]
MKEKKQNLLRSDQIFNELAADYDLWFDRHPDIFQSELNALKKIVPCKGTGLEIGVGTGRFAEKLGIHYGVEPAESMKILAEKRGIKVVTGVAEHLPFPDNFFDYAVMITTLCFVQDPFQALEEAKRVVKTGGRIIIGLIDRTSSLGKQYEEKKGENPYYKFAHFFSADEVENFLNKLKLKEISAFQTLFNSPRMLSQPDEIQEGYGKGGFVAIGGVK